MALPLGKLTILVGAGLIGSVLAKEGRLSNVSDFLSGAFKIALKQIGRDDSTSSVSKPRNDALMAQVNSLRQELQMLASSRPVTIVTASGKGANRFGIIIVVVVVGYGYVWWKGWKLPDMMFATRRSLSDACTSVGQQLENVYASIRTTRRQLSSNIDLVDSNLNEVAQLSANTQERVRELREDSETFGKDFLSVQTAVGKLEKKMGTIERIQDGTIAGVTKLCNYANFLEENIQASAASSQITFSPMIGCLPPASSESSTPSVSRSIERSNGISAVAEISSSFGISNDIQSPEQTNNGSSWFRQAFLLRTRSATNSVLHRTGSSKQQS